MPTMRRQLKNRPTKQPAKQASSKQKTPSKIGGFLFVEIFYQVVGMDKVVVVVLANSVFRRM